MYRLGEDMVVRRPLTAGAADGVEKEHRWLPRLAPLLPVAIPVPLGKGTPDEGLAEFVTALRDIDPTDGPPSYRAEHLATRDPVTRAALAELRGVVDTDAATAAWEAALGAPDWSGRPVWIHADLQPGNMLLAEGRLSAVIDFGCLGLGEPAVDLIVTWYVLPTEAHAVFRAGLDTDDATWARGRGWALSIALLELQAYRDSNAVMAAHARHVVHEVLADHEPAAHRATRTRPIGSYGSTNPSTSSVSCARVIHDDPPHVL